SQVLGAYYQDLLDTHYPAETAAGKTLQMGLAGRFGSGRARIRRVRMMDANGNICTSFRRGDRMRVMIDYTADPDVEAVDCAIPLSYEGTPVAYNRLQHQGLLSRPVDGQGRIELEFDSLPLLA